MVVIHAAVVNGRVEYFSFAICKFMFELAGDIDYEKRSYMEIDMHENKPYRT